MREEKLVLLVRLVKLDHEDQVDQLVHGVKEENLVSQGPLGQLVRQDQLDREAQEVKRVFLELQELLVH